MIRLAGLVLLALAACATTERENVASIGSPPLCAPGAQLGDLIVAPLTHWRADQKEKADRAAIAQGAIGEAFQDVRCATSVRILPIAPNGDVSTNLAQWKAEGAETAVVIRVEELGPIFIVSFPALWSTWSDVRFNVEAIDLASGAAMLKLDHHRKVGGAFEVRGVGPLQAEMEAALGEVIAGAPA
jgi:hypothetical protein